jgi:aminoglycoside N3'-acetyltransferase
VCAWGKDAEYFVEGHDKKLGPFGFDTPFYRFLERKGKGLILGANLGNFTILRCIEDIKDDYPHPIFCDRTFPLKVIDWEGNKKVVNTKVHNPIGSQYRDVDGILVPQFKKDGMLTEGRVGKARTYIVRGDGLFEYLENLLQKGISPWPHDFASHPG